MSSSCDGFERSARMPPWIFGCSVTTRWSRMGGTPVMSSTAVTGMPASAIALAVPPDETSCTPRCCSSRANSTTPVLSYTESRARLILVRVMPSSVLYEQLSEHFGIDPSFDFLDPLVEGLDRVVGEDGDRLLRQDRTLVDLQARQVHGAAGDLDARGERVVDRVPALERGERRRVGVDDAVGERVVDRLGQDGAE